MRANELRIENYVHYGPDKELACVKEIGKECVVFKCYDLETYDKIAPISLTEEILLKCGFEKMKTFSGIFSYKMKQGCIQIYWSRDHECYILENLSWVCIKYLHQLQNLYFALTNGELEIKL